MRVPFVDLHLINSPFRNSYFEKWDKVMSRSSYILGPEVEFFEKQFADYCDVPYCVGTGNGLDALRISLEALEIGEGDEVIVPSHTFIATWLAVYQTGATIVPVDVNVQTCNIDVSLIEESITPKTKAILPVHLYGQMVEMDNVVEIATRYNLFIVEDFAQAQGARYKSKKAGSFGHINATSFYPAKNLGALGDAGSLVTSDKTFMERARKIRNYGSDEKYIHESIGFNSRLDELQAVVLNTKLTDLDSQNAERRKVADKYMDRLKSVQQITLPYCHQDAEHIYHLFVIQAEKRDELQPFLKEKGIDSLIHYPIPPHRQKAFLGYFSSPKEFPVTEFISKRLLSLPMFPGLTDSQIDYVCENIIAFYN